MFDPLSSAGRDVITVADHVRTGAGRTRQQLARATGMGRNTVSTLLNTAVELGLVCPDGAGPSTGGRAPETWRFRHEEGLVLVTGVHTSTLHLAVTDLAGTPVNRLILAWPISRGPTATLAKAAEQLHDMAAPLEQAVWAAGVSLPGPIDQETGRPTAPPIMPGWDGFDVVGAMTGALGVPAVAANDVNTMLLGYATDLPDRTERRLQDVLYVQVGTGIGAGLMSHGALHWGADGAAGDIGHVRVSGSDAVVCRCGRTGCLEAVAGGWAVLRDALAMIVSCFNPGRVILAGPMPQGCAMFLQVARRIVNERALALATKHLEILPARDGADDEMRGTAVLAVNAVFRRAMS